MRNIINFENVDFGAIRTTMIDGEPWFVAKDVTAAFGYKNSRAAVSNHVESCDRRTAKFDTNGGEQTFSVINEPGVYDLLFASQLPNAKEIQRHFFKKVLPSIRKRGSYISKDAIAKIVADPDLVLDLARRYKEECERRNGAFHASFSI